jgi:hypothetical protein
LKNNQLQKMTKKPDSTELTSRSRDSGHETKITS